MTYYTIGYFTMMQDICKGYHLAKSARKQEKERLINANDWDGVKAFNEREKQFKEPFTGGYLSAYWAYENSKQHESNYFEVFDLPWDSDAHDFINCLKEAGVTEFAITSQSTALMELIHTFVDNENCKMVGTCKVQRKGDVYGITSIEEYNGILMQIT